MAYQSSTSISSPDQLIDALAAFCAANGWTVERNTLVASARTLTVRKAGITDYIHIYNTSNSQIRMRASVGYDGALTPAAQPNVSPADTLANALVGPYPNVWFFSDGDEINIVVRRSDTTGAYSHIAFGRLTKYGSYVGGTFVDGTFFNLTGAQSGTWDTNTDHALFGFGQMSVGYIRVDADGATNRWVPITSNSSATDVAHSGVGPLRVANTYSGNQLGSTFDISRLINAADANSFSGRSILYPIEFLVRRTGTPIYHSPAGYIANTRYVSLAKFDPEAELSIADETYMLFPVVRKASESSSSDAPNASGNNGFAIRKVP